MRPEQILEVIGTNPIITAVKNREGLKTCLETESGLVFILFGDICTIPEIVREVKAAGKIPIVHLDLLGGIGNKEIAVDFMKEQTEAEGIISTRPALLKRAKELGLFTVLRAFILDSMAFTNIQKQIDHIRPDCIEILPGVMPKITKRIVEETEIPVICGGLIADKEDIMGAISAGAVAISSTNQEVWIL